MNISEILLKQQSTYQGIFGKSKISEVTENVIRKYNMLP